MTNILKDCSISRLANAAGAAQTAVTSSLLDLRGYDGACILCAIGSIDSGGAVSLQLQTGDLSNGGDMADISGALAEADASDDNLLIAVEVKNVSGRYLRAVVTRSAADSVIDGIFAISTGYPVKPITQPASVADSTLTV